MVAGLRSRVLALMMAVGEGSGMIDSDDRYGDDRDVRARPCDGGGRGQWHDR